MRDATWPNVVGVSIVKKLVSVAVSCCMGPPRFPRCLARRSGSRTLPGSEPADAQESISPPCSDFRHCPNAGPSQTIGTMAEPQNIIELLIHDHRGMAVLAEQMDSEGTPEQIHEAFVEFTTEYAAHESAEHEVVYPALLDAVPAADRNALTCLGHHRELNDLLAGMRGLDPPSVGFEQRASALLLEVRAHFAA